MDAHNIETGITIHMFHKKALSHESDDPNLGKIIFVNDNMKVTAYAMERDLWKKKIISIFPFLIFLLYPR